MPDLVQHHEPHVGTEVTQRMIIAQPQCLLVLLAALVQDAQGLVAQHHLGLVGPVQGAGAVALGGHEAQASRQHEHAVDGLHFRQLPPQIDVKNLLVDRLQVGRLGGQIGVLEPRDLRLALGRCPHDPARAVLGRPLPRRYGQRARRGLLRRTRTAGRSSGNQQKEQETNARSRGHRRQPPTCGHCIPG